MARSKVKTGAPDKVRSFKNKWADGPFKLTELLNATGEKELDRYVEAANHMGAVHLCLQRWMNTIYLQAPNIPEKERASFVEYAAAWSKSTHVHHRGEEEHMFPEIEKAAHLPGWMQRNVEEHHVFEEGFKAFDAYIAELQADITKYDGVKIQQLLAAYAEPLGEHLQHELQSFVDIPKEMPKDVRPQDCDINGIMDSAGGRSMRQMAMFTDIASFWVNHDQTFDPRLSEFPPAPFVVLLTLKYVSPLVSSALLKFGCCDTFGQPKELPYAPAK